MLEARRPSLGTTTSGTSTEISTVAASTVRSPKSSAPAEAPKMAWPENPVLKDRRFFTSTTKVRPFDPTEDDREHTAPTPTRRSNFAKLAVSWGGLNLSDTRFSGRSSQTTITRTSYHTAHDSEADKSPKTQRRKIRTAIHDTAKLHQDIRLALEEERKENEKQRLLEKPPKHKEVSRQIVENSFFVSVTTLLTVYALIGDDIRLLCTHEPADPVFDGITTICFFVFALDCLLSSIGKPEYWLGFFFWLDFISTITLVLDITVVNDMIFQADDDDVQSMKSSKTARIGAKAARIVRVMRLVRILKLYKNVYEMQMRNARKEKEAGMQMKRAMESDDDWGDDHEEDLQLLQESVKTESNVGKKLSDLTTRRCVILVLGMIFFNPLLAPPGSIHKTSGNFGADMVRDKFESMKANSSLRWLYEDSLLRYVYYHNWHSKQTDEGKCPDSSLCPALYDNHLVWLGVAAGNTGNEADLRETAALAQIRDGTVQAWEDKLGEQRRGSSPVYNYGSMPGFVQRALAAAWSERCPTAKGYLRLGISLLSEGVDYLIRCPEELRKIERSFYTAEMVSDAEAKSYPFVFYFDNRPTVKAEAYANLLTTFFICCLLCGASMMFTADAQELVINPVETMMAKVQLIRLNPLLAATMTDAEFKREQIAREKSRLMHEREDWRAQSKKLRRILLCRPPTESKARPMETKILEKTIVKLGTLLSLGFGVAGMNIISSNIQNKDSASINAMVPGSIVKCVIVNARISDFSTFTQILQSRVMTFVNQVSEIVHGLVDAYHGASSGNSGDTFVAVWKVLEDDDDAFSRQLADLSIVAVSLMVAGINMSARLAAYRNHPGLQQRLGSSCRVSMTFGAHFGWAIEGALGSEYKIDATYVSPNVSIAESVQQASEKYGTNILLSEAAHDSLSADMATKCRLIDRVKIRGATTPMNLYCLDLNVMALPLEKPIENHIGMMRFTTRQRFRARQVLAREKAERLMGKKMSEFFDTHPAIACMRRAYSREFHELFGMCYQNYSQGEWPTATRLLLRAEQALGFLDGPCEALGRFMDLHAEGPEELGARGSCAEKQAPNWWKGYHCLEEMPHLSRDLLDALRSTARRASTKQRPPQDAQQGFAKEALPVAFDSEKSMLFSVPSVVITAPEEDMVVPPGQVCVTPGEVVDQTVS